MSSQTYSKVDNKKSKLVKFECMQSFARHYRIQHFLSNDFTFTHLVNAFIQRQLITAFKVYILSVQFPGNQTHDLAIAGTMLYCLSYRNACQCKTWHLDYQGLATQLPMCFNWELITRLLSKGFRVVVRALLGIWSLLYI